MLSDCHLSLFLIAFCLFPYPWQATFSAQHPGLHACFSHVQRYRTGYSRRFHKPYDLVGVAGVPDEDVLPVSMHKCLHSLLQGGESRK